ncbi:MAG: DsbA family protein [Rhodoferax sp.]|uniref:DsbA family protein n=1 Tax=Rhodoferax sp. TaxID=50421 RepID=UPI003266FA71
MPTTLTYLFDPLCGWCYGASPVLQQLGQHPDYVVELAPTGLFAGGGRTMDAAFADYAWSNDQRIAKLTGQRFTEAYRSQVLGQLGSRFDSSTATLALTAVSLDQPQRELEALKLLQEARYVDGLDTTDVPVVAQLLRGADLAAAADRLLANDAALHQANTARLQRGQTLMHSLGINGVPALVVSTAGGSRLLPGNALFGSFEQLLGALQA